MMAIGSEPYRAKKIIEEVLKLVQRTQIVTYLEATGWVLEDDPDHTLQVYHQIERRVRLELPLDPDQGRGFQEALERLAAAEKTSFVSVVCHVTGLKQIVLWSDEGSEDRGHTQPREAWTEHRQRRSMKMGEQRQTTDSSHWLGRLQPGDRVFTQLLWYGQEVPFQLDRHTVESRQPDGRITIDHFSGCFEADGTFVIPNSPSESFILLEDTPERELAFQRLLRAGKLSAAFDRYKWSDLSLEQLEKLAQLVATLTAKEFAGFVPDSNGSES